MKKRNYKTLRNYILGLLIILPCTLFAQINKIEKIIEKIQKNDFEKAIELKNKLKDETPIVLNHFVNHLIFNDNDFEGRNIDSSYSYLLIVSNDFKLIEKPFKIDYCSRFKLCEEYLMDERLKLENEAFILYSKDSTLVSLNYFIDHFKNELLKQKSLKLIETIEYDNAKKTNTSEVFKEYLLRYPNSSYTSDVKNRLEELIFEMTLKKNTLYDFRNFLTQYPNSKRYDKEIKGLIEIILYDNLVKSFSIDGYQSFIDEFPNSNYKVELRSKFAKTKYDQLIKTNDVSQKSSFIIEFSDYHELNIDSLWLSFKKDVVIVELNNLLSNPKTDLSSILKYTSINKTYINSSLINNAQKKVDEIVLKNLNYYSNLNTMEFYLKSFGKTKIFQKLDSSRIIKELSQLNNDSEIKKYFSEYENQILMYGIQNVIKILVPSKIDFDIIDAYGYINIINNNVEIYPIFQEARPFINGYAAVKYNDKWGFINKSGLVIIDLIYDEVKDFYKNVCCVKRDGLWQILTNQNEPISNNQYQDLGVFNSKYINVMSLTSGWGFIDTEGNVIKPFVYRNATPFVDGYSVVSEKDEYQLIDSTFKTIDIEIRGGSFFKDLEENCYRRWESNMRRWIYCEPNAGDANWTPSTISKKDNDIIINGIFSFNLNSKGLSLFPFSIENENQSNNRVIKRFDVITTYEGYGYYLSKDNYLNNKSSFTSATPFVDNRAIVQVSGNFLMIDTNGNQIGKVYNRIDRVNKSLFIVNDGMSEFLIDKNANPLSSDYDEIDRQMFFGTFRVKSNGKYGLIDEMGNELFEPSFNYFTPFNGEMSIARIKEDCGYRNYKSLCDFYVLIDYNGVWISKSTSTRLIFTLDGVSNY